MCLCSKSPIIAAVPSGRVLAISLYLFVCFVFVVVVVVVFCFCFCFFFAVIEPKRFICLGSVTAGREGREDNPGARVTLVLN